MGIYIMLTMKRLSALVCVFAILGSCMGCQDKNTMSSGAKRGKEPFTFTHNQGDLEEAYILNTSSGRIHLPDCTYAETIAPHNRLPVSDLSQALAEGYTYCSRCLSNHTDTENEENEHAEC